MSHRLCYAHCTYPPIISCNFTGLTSLVCCCSLSLLCVCSFCLCGKLLFSNHMVDGSGMHMSWQDTPATQKCRCNILDRLLQLECTPEVCCILQVFKGTFQKPNLSLAEMQVHPPPGCVAYLTIAMHSRFQTGHSHPIHDVCCNVHGAMWMICCCSL